MTQEQIYEQIRLEHPDWNHAQLLTQTRIRMTAEETISQHPDMKAGDNDIIRMILNAVERWLIENWPAIWEEVKNWFNRILNDLVDWIKEHGWNFFLNLFTEDY